MVASCPYRRTSTLQRHWRADGMHFCALLTTLIGIHADPIRIIRRLADHRHSPPSRPGWDTRYPSGNAICRARRVHLGGGFGECVMFGAESGNGEPLCDTPFGARCIGKFEQPASRGDRVPLCVTYASTESSKASSSTRTSVAAAPDPSANSITAGCSFAVRGASRSSVTMLPG